MPFKPFDEGGEVIRYENNLPHWRQDAVTYFVTFRLGDFVPQPKLRAWAHEHECWMNAHGLKPGDSLDALPEKKRQEYHRRFTKTFHDWLDAGMGECVLRRGDAAKIVADALCYFAGERYELDAWVVMPNHVHGLLCPLGGHALEKILHLWKSLTAHELNKLFSRAGALWQRESYDHIVRSEEQFARDRRYIRENPLKAKLREGEYLLSECS